MKCDDFYAIPFYASRMKKYPWEGVFGCLLCLVFLLAGCTNYSEKANHIFESTGIKGGIIVHAGVEDGRLTAALYQDSAFAVHGLTENMSNVRKARKYILDNGFYGRVSVEHWNGQNLPYVDNMVDLFVADREMSLPMEEILRVLSPGGIAYIKRNDQWIKREKPWPDGMDDWPHYLYNTTNNAVSQDTLVEPPRNLQWVGKPEWTRHHDLMESISAMVSSGGRIFYILDEGPAASIYLPSDWKLIARNAFNGKILWKKSIHSWVNPLWPLKSGPVQLPRRLVAQENQVFATLSIDGPLKKIDAATGEVLHTYDQTRGTDEILYSDGTIYILVNPDRNQSRYNYEKGMHKFHFDKEIWERKDLIIKAIDAQSGNLLWKKETPVLPLSLTVDDSRAYFHDGQCLHALNRSTGEAKWKSQPLERPSKILSYFAPMLVIHDDVVLYASGEVAVLQRYEWSSKDDQLTALSAQTGEVLWSSPHPPSGYRSLEDIFVMDDVVWMGDITSGIKEGKFTGRDLHTGTLVDEFRPNVSMHWFHHRCYRNKATSKYIIAGRTGIEYIDPSDQHWDVNHWLRGTCLYGTMPANGLTYSPPHACACYPEAKLSGFNALTGSRPTSRNIIRESALVKGKAYDMHDISSKEPNRSGWATYRHDMARSGYTKTTVPEKLNNHWNTSIGGDLTSLVMADNTVYVARKDNHTLYALNASNGKHRWQYTTGGRIDSPPTIYHNKVYFGAADGCVYCLKASGGELIWKFQAAPNNQKIMANGQLESLWPVPGNVMIKNGEVWFVAGRSMFLDGGLYLYRLDAATGEKIAVNNMSEYHPESGQNLQKASTWLTMPVALPDILSTDGKYVYMRSQKFNQEGKRLEIDQLSDQSYEQLMGREMKSEFSQMFNHAGPLQVTFKNYHHLFLDSMHSANKEGNHLFAPYGYLDDSWFHRAYWVYGKHYLGGWNGYYVAGKYAPSGRIVVHDRDNVYAFGRKPQYYRWTKPMEYHLFSASKSMDVDTTLLSDKTAKLERIGAEPMPYQWNTTIPILAQAMVKADNNLFVGGPPDLLNEEQAQRHYTDSLVQANMKKQHEALNGKHGGLLWAFDGLSGKVLRKYQIASPPVWDGLIAADHKLFIATMDWNVVCWGK